MKHTTPAAITSLDDIKPSPAVNNNMLPSNNRIIEITLVVCPFISAISIQKILFLSAVANIYGIRTMNDNQSAFYANQGWACFFYRGKSYTYDIPQDEFVVYMASEGALNWKMRGGNSERQQSL